MKRRQEGRGRSDYAYAMLGWTPVNERSLYIEGGGKRGDRGAELGGGWGEGGETFKKLKGGKETAAKRTTCGI